MAVMLVHYETLVRCDVILALMLKSICIAQQEEHPPMLALIVLKGDQKRKNTCAHPACLLCDMNAKIFQQFFAMFLVLVKFNKPGTAMLFKKDECNEVDEEH